MSGHKNVIHLNGKLYDSRTGKIVTHHTAPLSGEPVVVSPQNSVRTVDGFIVQPATKPSAAKKVAVHSSPQKPAKSRNPAKSIASHTRNRSQTLKRSGLKKPKLKSSAQAETELKPTAPKKHVYSSARLERAKAVPQSAKISRFGLPSYHHHAVTKKVAEIPVRQSPAQLAHQKATKAHAHSTAPTNNQVLKEQLVAKAMRDAPDKKVHHKKAKKHRVSNKLGVSPRIVHFGAGTLAALLLIGFIAYQNAPNISMRIASSKAGFNASIPGYAPAGFAMSGPIEYGPGQVTLNFKSASDQRNFHVTQKSSNWTSEALLSNFVATNNETYETFNDNGRTIYIYDGSNATWVNGGVWYQIEGNSSLSSDQLVRMASSI